MIGILITLEGGLITSIVASKDRELLEISFDEMVDELDIEDGDDVNLYIFDEDELEHGVCDHIEAVYLPKELT